MSRKIIFLLFIVAVMLAAVGTLGAFTLPDTGQVICFDEDGQIPCPAEGEPFYGQDAQYATQPSAYQDNADGTVSDTVTNLMWQQNEGSPRTWGQAKFYCDGLSTGGHSDWDLPEFHELESLILYGKDPAFDVQFFSSCVANKATWTATEHAVEFSAWYIDFYDGWQADVEKSVELCVRCVRNATMTLNPSGAQSDLAE